MPSRGATEDIKKFNTLLNGTVGSSLSVVELGDGIIHQTIITFTNFSFTMTDATTNGSEGNKTIYTFPRALLNILAASTDLTIARVSTGLAATAAVVGSIGTVAAGADDTLTSTEADIIPSTACTLSSGAGVFKGESTAALFKDGTTVGGSARSAILNFAVADAGTSATDALLVNGTITITWVHGGDN